MIVFGFLEGEKMLFQILLRTCVGYFILLLMLKIMGKREIGQLSLFDLIILLSIADIMIIGIENYELNYWYVILPIVLLSFLQKLIAFVILKSKKLRNVFDGNESVIIYKGKINIQEMKKLCYNFDDLLPQLRQKDIRSIEEVEYAILENNGQMSFLTSSNSSQDQSSSSQSCGPQGRQSSSSDSKSPPSNNEDSTLNTQGGNSQNQTSSNSNNQTPHLPVIYVLDGHVNRNSLTTSGKNKYWIESELKKHGINSIKDVVLFMTDTNGKFVYQLIDEYEKGCSK